MVYTAPVFILHQLKNFSKKQYERQKITDDSRPY